MADPAPSSIAALDAVNDGFHQAYASAREADEADAPVLVVLADTLALVQKEQRRAVDFTPELFHVIKSVVHAPVAFYAAFRDPARLARLRDHVHASVAALEARAADRTRAAVPEEPGLVTRLLAILRETETAIEAILAPQSRAGQSDPAARDAFARAIGPRLLESTDDATALQLTALDRAARELLEPLSPRVRARVEVVVAGAHQARARSLGMQYFGMLLGPDAERRLVYAESIETEAEAVQLVGTRRLDRAIATAFFGEADRLERDVLGDSVKSRLEGFEPEAAGLLGP